MESAPAVAKEFKGVRVQVSTSLPKQKDFELALSLATSHPQLFEVGHEYDFADFQKAISHVSSPDKTGIVLLRSPA